MSRSLRSLANKSFARLLFVSGHYFVKLAIELYAATKRERRLVEKIQYIQISKEDVCGNIFLNGMQLQMYFLNENWF